MFDVAGAECVTTVTNSRKEIVQSLADKGYRDAFVSAEIATTIPLQLKAMRAARGWTQKQLAAVAKMPQGRISILENPDYEGAMNVHTLERLASAFDVALVVRFAPFSEVVGWTSGLSAKDHKIPPYQEDDGLRDLPVAATDQTLVYTVALDVNAFANQLFNPVEGYRITESSVVTVVGPTGLYPVAAASLQKQKPGNVFVFPSWNAA